MPYIPCTDADRAAMLERIGAKSIEELFDAIPKKLRMDKELDIAPGLSESAVMTYMSELGEKNHVFPAHRILAGGGVYCHFIPPVVKELVHRGEFYTAYTPYQPEISQGMLQAIFEYQSYICLLTGMEVSNASSYDGGTALMDAVLMARNATKRSRILLPPYLNPQYREVVETYNLGMAVELVTLPADADGAIDRKALDKELAAGNVAALVIQFPNYMGFYEEDIPGMVKAAHDAGALAVFSAYPFTMGVTCTPGEMGADIVTGEGQPLGIAPSFGGPYLGYCATTMKLVRQLPGRIVGKTSAAFGREGYVMTLQAREQHIRRDKAASNICSNEALCALQATIYMSVVGKHGFHHIARKCEENAHYAAKKLGAMKGLRIAFPKRAFFNEFAVQLEKPENLCTVRDALMKKGWLPGIIIEDKFPSVKGGLLLAFTELQDTAAIDEFAKDMQEALNV